MKKLLLSALFLLNATAKTTTLSLPKQYEEIDCSLDANSPVLATYKAQEGNFLNCEQVTEFEATISKTASLAKSFPRVTLLISKQSDNASFDRGSIIRVPLRLTFPNRWGNYFYGDYNSNQIVLAHEYGHAILNEKLSDEVFFKPIKNLADRSSQLELSIQHAYEDNKSKNEIQNILDAYNSNYQAMYDDKDQLRISKILSPYHELFADLIAALAFDNKSAMIEALYYNEMSDDKFDNLLTRDFKKNHLKIKANHLKEDHALFAPTRRFIGENLWPTNDIEKTKLLGLVFNSIVVEMKKHADSGEGQINPIKANEDLIKLLSDNNSLE